MGYLEIGKIVAAQGLKGELRVYPNTDFPERFEEPGERWLLRPNQTEPEVIELVSGRYLDGKGLYVIQIKGIRDRDAAEALRGCQLLVPDSDRPDLEEGEFHVADLLGLSVYEQASQELIGTVSDVIPAGHDLLEVKKVTPEGRTILIPFVEAIVPVVDLAQRRIEITPPPGLLDL
ncbi:MULTISPECIES: ribosome maturation factor RimM [Leptolyngbya]|jgi:16S rRNA processing protein RimM|uniref:Ribosome maturation factor RimM n=1 Tax=Leptolyngbya boryana NIES-2135 TaxID=1973484 RepID=A0A1Z4JC02_LEPBY|nr:MULTISPECIES: ribosome maturation factor RimM [Leptolyngbya]BAY54261.1 16S rRNA processing protein RimM [Leptolyngbya boryana NIES-2135]MBD1858756.1 ribosome maturation factor RimM [Leptolyngbya sp. FACHB-1624]MBD2371498.1 ribosome maturation factor RimM [Leptolyngbya sp. FACHB-161]MBD2378037.1 ribosome maturation factor RimM [Leptolyngbya sp. FACHB-238]MBD2402457.1 ribosome maturation factor RimM [Leptolyngbya sp. FACHB-239]